MDDLADMIAEIRSSSTRSPASPSAASQVQPVVPDVLVRPATRRQLARRTQQRHAAARAGQPQSTTRASSRNAASDARTRTTSLDCLQTANWLVKSLDQRARTILRVAEEIVRQQDALPRPWRAASAAAQPQDGGRRDQDARIDGQPRHVEQVHRDPARHLRAEVLLHLGDPASGDGEAHSSEAVRHRIKQLIDAESRRGGAVRRQARRACSKDDGIDIARRTVAKYREAMRIPSSVQRRREKRLMDTMERAG